MNKRKLAVRGVALVVAYGLSCSDPRELFLHPTRSPARAVGARAAASPRPFSKGSLSVEQVTSVVRAVSPSLEATCGLAADTSPAMVSGKVLLRLFIEASGNVRRLERDEATVRSELAACVARGLAPLHFPDGSAESLLTVSIAASPPAADPKLELWTAPVAPD